MRACHCIVEGRVQGVGFRYFTQRVAQDLGVCGWVRNLIDGTVEIHAEGEEKVLESFFQRIGRGPSFSRVTALRTSDAELQGFDYFQTRV